MSRLGRLNSMSVVAVAGDWHGEAAHAARTIRSLAGKVDAILHLGDFGWLFTDEFVSCVEAAAAESGIVVCFVDGNHEDFDSLLALSLDEEGIRPVSEHVWHMPRGLRWTMFHGLVDFLALGGAHSVNRSLLVPGASWWPQESITYGNALRAAKGGAVDVMLTHEAPYGSIVPGLDLPSRWPAADLEASAAQRQLVQGVVDIVRPVMLWHGHHHVKYQCVLASGTVVRGLAHEGRPQDNVSILHLVDVVRMKEQRKEG